MLGFDFGFHRRDSGDVTGDAFGFLRRELEVIRSCAGEQFLDEVGIAGGDFLVGRDFMLEALDLLFRAVHFLAFRLGSYFVVLPLIKRRIC